MNFLETIVRILFFICMWILIGSFVLSAIDDEKRRLFHWANNCPILLGYEMLLILWPVVFFIWLYIKISYKNKG